MAAKKEEKELTTEERLKALYQLQAILSEADAKKAIRGDLPREVQNLSDEIEGLETRISNLNADIKTAQSEIKKNIIEIEEAKRQIEHYTMQLDNVRNNREFEFINKEIEYTNLNIQLAEKNIRDYKRKCEDIAVTIEKTQAELEDRHHILTTKKDELEEIMSETKQVEEKLRDQAKKIESKIDDERLLSAFKRIRSNARNGIGIAYVQRNACGGCFNRIPAQRQMEIKMRKKIIVCEYCGRILIDADLAGVEVAE